MEPGSKGTWRKSWPWCTSVRELAWGRSRGYCRWCCWWYCWWYWRYNKGIGWLVLRPMMHHRATTVSCTSYCEWLPRTCPMHLHLCICTYASGSYGILPYSGMERCSCYELVILRHYDVSEGRYRRKEARIGMGDKLCPGEPIHKLLVHIQFDIGNLVGDMLSPFSGCAV